ncbi:cornifelin homolog [Latimeria chalumnae]|uniref:cornifelin homolog n=1 Tax=Latimeria chalumnae TaxID=7897 RepID=UPI00313C78B9
MAYQSEVFTSQPQMTVTTFSISNQSSSWSSGLCDCCADMSICLCGVFLPCILACRVAQDFEECCCVAFLPGSLLAMRTGIRERYHISGSVCDDWVAMCCCGPCSLCQMARELTRRK